MNNLHNIINNNNRISQILFLLKQQVKADYPLVNNRELKQCIFIVKNVFQVIILKKNDSIGNGRYIKGFFSPDTEDITLCNDTIESKEEVFIPSENTKLVNYNSSA